MQLQTGATFLEAEQSSEGKETDEEKVCSAVPPAFLLRIQLRFTVHHNINTLYAFKILLYWRL